MSIAPTLVVGGLSVTDAYLLAYAHDADVQPTADLDNSLRIVLTVEKNSIRNSSFVRGVQRTSSKQGLPPRGISPGKLLAV